MIEDSVRLKRLAQARLHLKEVAARVSEMSAQIPEPVASAAEALRSLSPEQQEALRVHRTEALQLLAQQIVEEQAELSRLTAQHEDAMREWQQLVARGDWALLTDHEPTLNDRRDELEQRRTALQELRALHNELRSASEPSTCV